jgi:hypothetical protein
MAGGLKAQYTANAAGLRKMLEKAINTGRPVNGFSEGQLRDRVAEYERLAAMSEEDLRAWVSRVLSK